MPDITITPAAVKLLAARDAAAQRALLNLQPLGWSWRYSTEPAGHHDGDRCITTDTGGFVAAREIYLDSGFTVTPGGQGPEQRWKWFADRGVLGYAQLQAVNRPNAFAVFWVTRIVPYGFDNGDGTYGPLHAEPPGDVDGLIVEPVDVDKAPRFEAGDEINVVFFPVGGPIR